jgi:glutamate dehydrogenase (NAD(P)+)
METHKPYNIFEMAQTQFDRTADQLGLDQPTRDLLRLPMREYQFSIPVSMDNGESKIFRGFTVQHNNALGPTKGGVRFHPDETIDTIRALAMWMTWKCAVVKLPLGGSSSGVSCDPNLLSPKEMERVCRGFVRKVAHITGPEMDVLGPDIMIGPQQILWMLDEYEAIAGRKSPGFITGKPLSQIGSRGRKEACGYGVMITVREALKDLNMPIDQTTASIQGFGSVGQHAAQLYSQLGGVVISIACWNHRDRTAYTFRRKEGIDIAEMIAITNVFGEIDRQKAETLGYECLPGDDWIKQHVDILVPAAVENQIRMDNVDTISQSVKIIAEAANGPTDLDVEPILNQRNILIIPDLLANAGGVVTSYFEQVQSNMNYAWSKEEVLGKLDNHMASAYLDVSNFAAKNDLTLRDAALFVAIDRVVADCEGRGWV